MIQPPDAKELVQSVDRAISILQSLGNRAPATVGEIAQDVQLHKSTTSRLLSTLESRGMVEQDGERGRYRLGALVTWLASGATTRPDLAAISRPICEALAIELGETVAVSVLDSEAVMTVTQAAGASIVASVEWVGKRDPLHATAAGKVLLAHLSATEVDERLDLTRRAFTSSTIVDEGALRLELEQVRARGWSSTHEEHELGLVALGVPISDAYGDVIGALTVSGPSYRLSEERSAQLVQRLLPSADVISRRLGASPSKRAAP